ncbi:MAG: hypothetical protein R6T98_07350 [Desulfatiglandales bacterium]
MEAEANKEIDLSVWHVHDLLDGFFSLVVVGQERQLPGEFRINGLLNETEKCLYLSPSGGFRWL